MGMVSRPGVYWRTSTYQALLTKIQNEEKGEITIESALERRGQIRGQWTPMSEPLPGVAVPANVVAGGAEA